MRHVVQYSKETGKRISIFRSVRVAAMTAGTSYVTFSRHMRSGGGELRGNIWLFQGTPAPIVEVVKKPHNENDHRYGERKNGYVVPGVIYCQSCGRPRTPKLMVQICVDCVEDMKNVKELMSALAKNPNIKVIK